MRPNDEILANLVTLTPEDAHLNRGQWIVKGFGCNLGGLKNGFKMVLFALMHCR
jgi:hypothetical protein